MMNVLLVDDEFFTIRMLQNLLDWEALGIQVSGYALNGQEAYEKVRENPPDIVITDIRMPVLDGLEFMKRVIRETDKVKFIIMSAYADVAYLREAMKLGCCDYIIKPIDEYELEDTLRRVIRKIQGENEKERLITRSSEQLEHMSLYHYMTTGQGWKQKKLSPQSEWLNHCPYAVFLIQEDSGSINEYVTASQMKFVRNGYLSNTMRGVLKEAAEHFLLFDYEEGVWIAVLALNPAVQKEKAARKLLERLEEETGLHLNLCFSLDGHTQEELPALYEEVSGLAKYSFYVGEERILGYGYNCDKKEFDEVCSIGRLKEAEHEKVKRDESGCSRPVRESLEILKQHYNENLSLDEICGKVSVSKNYFCYLFKREVGMSVWNYLTRIRLNEAKELLEKTDLKSYEIAFQVGYDNPSYFSKLFKKYETVSPNEYREKTRKAEKG